MKNFYRREKSIAFYDFGWLLTWWPRGLFAVFLRWYRALSNTFFVSCYEITL